MLWLRSKLRWWMIWFVPPLSFLGMVFALLIGQLSPLDPTPEIWGHKANWSFLSAFVSFFSFGIFLVGTVLGTILTFRKVRAPREERGFEVSM